MCFLSPCQYGILNPVFPLFLVGSDLHVTALVGKVSGEI